MGIGVPDEKGVLVLPYIISPACPSWALTQPADWSPLLHGIFFPETFLSIGVCVCACVFLFLCVHVCVLKYSSMYCV